MRLLIALMLLGTCVRGAAAASPSQEARDNRPNIIIILADDMGYSDVGCYGGEIQTPNIDRLASEGVRFTQFYNMARCCPTRAALMTGLYPHQAGVGAMCRDLGKPAYQGQLNDRCATIAEVLGNAGYRTAMVGKWHLSNLSILSPPWNRGAKKLLNFESDGPISLSKQSWPCNRGFKEHWGTIGGVGNFYDPWSLVHNETPIAPPNDFYYTDFISDTACRMVDDFSKEQKPFFLYVAHTAPHWPLHAREKDISKYADTYKMGWDELRRRRYQKMIELGIIKPAWQLSPRAQVVHKANVLAWEDAPDKQWEARRMAVYAAMIDAMDQGIGRLLDKLAEHKIDQNTLIFFLSDNGGCAENVQLSWYDIPTKTRDWRAIAVGNDPKVNPGDDSTFMSYGPAWGNASNTPFRSFKHYTEEGGISTPLIVRWPARIKRSSQLETQVGHVIDLMPTCLAAAQTPYPAKHGERELVPLEGMNLLEAIDGKQKPRTLYWEHEGSRAVRHGSWKLLAAHEAQWQLYELESDRTELNDLAAGQPDKVRAMRAMYDAWANRVGVEPWPVKQASAPE
jgi:arylsulfatase A-like enzyme